MEVCDHYDLFLVARWMPVLLSFIYAAVHGVLSLLAESRSKHQSEIESRTNNKSGLTRLQISIVIFVVAIMFCGLLTVYFEMKIQACDNYRKNLQIIEDEMRSESERMFRDSLRVDNDLLVNKNQVLAQDMIRSLHKSDSISILVDKTLRELLMVSANQARADIKQSHTIEKVDALAHPLFPINVSGTLRFEYHQSNTQYLDSLISSCRKYFIRENHGNFITASKFHLLNAREKISQSNEMSSSNFSQELKTPASDNRERMLAKIDSLIVLNGLGIVVALGVDSSIIEFCERPDLIIGSRFASDNVQISYHEPINGVIRLDFQIGEIRLFSQSPRLKSMIEVWNGHLGVEIPSSNLATPILEHLVITTGDQTGTFDRYEFHEPDFTLMHISSTSRKSFGFDHLLGEARFLWVPGLSIKERMNKINEEPLFLRN